MKGKAASWSAWRAFLAALFGLPLSPAELEVYQRCTARNAPPTEPFTEAALVCGRRSGKSYMLALIATYLATHKSYRPFLASGEVATIMVIAVDRRQARHIMRYIKGLLKIPMLAKLVEAEAADSVTLRGSVVIEVAAASFRSTRGYSCCAVLVDELAFWPTGESAEPDYEVLDALRPSLGSIPGSMLLLASSPYAQRGALYDTYRKYYGRDDAPILVWQAPTKTMNPRFSQTIIDRAMERDPAHATAEYLAQFRTDVEAFITREAVEACIVPGILERPYLREYTYYAFTDPAGGSGDDSMTIAIAHSERHNVVLDCIREIRPRFSPEAATAEFAKLALSYNVTSIQGDRFAGEWPREAFASHGVDYLPCQHSKSELYIDALSLINSRRAVLLDSPRLVAQFVGLVRRTGRGKDAIDHPQGANCHDDVSNSCAGVLTSCILQVQQHIPNAPAWALSVPRNLPTSDMDTRNPALGAGSGMNIVGESTMDRAARGSIKPQPVGSGVYDWGWIRAASL